MIAKALTGKDKILFGVDDVDNEIEQNLEEESGNVPLPEEGNIPLPDNGDNGGETKVDTIKKL